MTPDDKQRAIHSALLEAADVLERTAISEGQFSNHEDDPDWKLAKRLRDLVGDQPTLLPPTVPHPMEADYHTFTYKLATKPLSTAPPDWYDGTPKRCPGSGMPPGVQFHGQVTEDGERLYHCRCPWCDAQHVPGTMPEHTFIPVSPGDWTFKTGKYLYGMENEIARSCISPGCNRMALSRGSMCLEHSPEGQLHAAASLDVEQIRREFGPQPAAPIARIDAVHRHIQGAYSIGWLAACDGDHPAPRCADPKCWRTCEDLQAFSDGELEASRADAFREHLKSCQSCRSELVEANQLDARLTTLPPKETP